jgi:hypothetical protein
LRKTASDTPHQAQGSPDENVATVADRAYAFSERWKEADVEIQDSQSFWTDFFDIFGVDRRWVAKFERPVKVYGRRKRIDLLWPGVLLVEQKSKGENLDRAQSQAERYIIGLALKEKPRFLLVSDFQHFRLCDLDHMDKKPEEFALSDLHTRIHLFDFMLGGGSRNLVDEVQVNTKAAELMGELHDALKESGYTGTVLEVFLVRAMFCMFADHSGIFDEQRLFTQYIEEHTEPDGSNVGVNLNEFFRILDIEPGARPGKLAPLLAALPHVNGSLFKDRFEPPTFDAGLRTLLLECCHFDWSGVSPAIFGTMFQSVTDPKERRNLGAHYTSETNILKVIGPLFLDDLKAELSACGNNKRALGDFLVKISRLKFLDPACGCGNFLAIAYRELRKLDTEVRVRLKNLTSGSEQQVFAQSMRESMKGAIDVDNFYGIENQEFPCKIAEAALWLMDHQSNREYSERVGIRYLRLPLTKTAVIVRGNALRLSWDKILPKDQANFILGNPPFVGQTYRTDEQNEDMVLVFEGVPNKSRRIASLDYVSAWYVKAAQYIQDTEVRVAFVSTKSITQGEQVGPLWSTLLNTYHVKIQFAHQTFKWTNEARGKAAVHCIIIGFGLSEVKRPAIFEYETVESEPHRVEVRHINPYLVDAADVLLYGRAKPLCEEAPEMRVGNALHDDGHYLFTDAEKDAFLRQEPSAAKYMRPWIGSAEFINGFQRYCLWLGDDNPDVNPAELRTMPEVMRRIDAVRRFRSLSSTASTREKAETPREFYFKNIPTSAFVVVPKTSSERRTYIPMGFLTPDYLPSDAVRVVPNATLYHFGVLHSAAHMDWVRRACGRLKSDYRYSSGIVYNNFPWPKDPKPAQIRAVEHAAQELLDIRGRLLVPGTSLAVLYDPLAMPMELARAHQKLDSAVDRCYRPAPFKSAMGRVRFLFSLYQKYCPSAAPLESYSNSDEDETDEG